MHFPHWDFSFAITKIDDKKETVDFINNLSLIRYQMDPIFNNNIHGTIPIENIPQQKQYFGLINGFT